MFTRKKENLRHKKVVRMKQLYGVLKIWKSKNYGCPIGYESELKISMRSEAAQLVALQGAILKAEGSLPNCILIFQKIVIIGDRKIHV